MGMFIQKCPVTDVLNQKSWDHYYMHYIYTTINFGKQAIFQFCSLLFCFPEFQCEGWSWK